MQQCTATLRDLTVTGANGSGGIFVFDATLTLDNVAITGNQASAGGGVANDATSTLTLEVGSSVTGNTTDTAADIENKGTLIDNGGTIGECDDVDAGCGCPDGAVCPP